MEAPTCPRCKTRHWSSQSCIVVCGPILEADQTPTPKVEPYVRVPVPKAPKKIGATKIPASEGCAVCAARRERDAARAKRYRERKGK